MPEEEIKQEKEEKPEVRERPETITTTIEVEKELFLKFKALCVLNETTISSEIEKLIRKRVEEMTSKNESVIVSKD